MADVKYNVYRDGEQIESGIEETTYTDSGLEPNTTYEYQVSAENESGEESELSEKVSATTDYSPIDNLSLSEDELSIDVDGDSETLVATVEPDTAKQDVAWSSSDEEVATVEDGNVTPVGEGEATITATSGADDDITATCAVTVTSEAEEPEAVSDVEATSNSDTETEINWN